MCPVSFCLVTHHIQNPKHYPVLKYFTIIRMAPVIWQLQGEMNSNFWSEQKFWQTLPSFI